MRIALILYPSVNESDLAQVAGPLSNLDGPDRPELVYCTRQPYRPEEKALAAQPVEVLPSLAGFDAIVIPGGRDLPALNQDGGWLDWLRSGEQASLKAAVGNGAQALSAAGILTHRVGQNGYRAALDPAESYPTGERHLLAEGVVVAQQAGNLGRALRAQLGGPEASPEESFSAADLRRDPVLIPATGSRRGDVERATRETQVRVSLDLDGSGQAEIATGLGFLDHMLEQVAAHGLFDLKISAQGDLHIDPHHTVEDVGLALGKAFDQALGERRGIVRMASEAAPMDETLAQVTLDFSGRPYTVFQCSWSGPMVGQLPTSLFEHFLESFAQQARLTLHVQVPYGRDDHHKAEAIFKALARALAAAVRLDPRRGGQIPSTKGSL